MNIVLESGLPFLTSAVDINFSRWDLEFLTISSDGCANSVSRSEGSRIGSLGCTARYRTADSMRCSNGENDSSIGRSSVGSLALLVSQLTE